MDVCNRNKLMFIRMLEFLDYLGVKEKFLDDYKSFKNKSDSCFFARYEINDFELLDAIEEFDTENICFFKSRDNNRKYLGFGIGPKSDKMPSFVVYPFSANSIRGIWNNFEKQYHIHPNILIIQDKITEVLINIIDSSSIKISRIKRSQPLPKLCSLSHSPNLEGWMVYIDKSKILFKDNVLDKIVFARQSELHFNSKINYQTILVKLLKNNIESFAFALKQGEDVFLGASPELLFKIEHNQLFTDALAGTRPRGNSESEDLKYEDDLLKNHKEKTEHSIVISYIINQLEPLAENVEKSKTYVKKLATVQHLHTKISAKIKHGIDWQDCLKSLHPTPAVAGMPKDSAILNILEIEDFHRGYYSGAFGIVDINYQEFAVAIRSGLICDDRIYLYSGAGIVEDSVAENEWDEINNKLKNFTRIFEND